MPFVSTHVNKNLCWHAPLYVVDALWKQHTRNLNFRFWKYANCRGGKLAFPDMISFRGGYGCLWALAFVCVWGWGIWQRRESFFLKRLVTRRNSNFLDKNRKFLKKHLKKGFLFSSKRIHFCENCVTQPTPSILYIGYTKKHLKDAAEDKQLQFSNSYSFVQLSEIYFTLNLFFIS